MDKGTFKLFENTDNNPKFPYIEAVKGPWEILFSNGRRFLLLGFAFAVIMSIFSILWGKAFVCSYKIYGEVNFYCQQNEWKQLVYLGGKALFLAVYLYAWVNWGNIGLKDKEKRKSVFKQIAKLWCILLSMTLSVIIPLISYMVLAFRVPNPDWRIESAYFTFVALGFVAPFILIRFFVTLSFAAENKPIPVLREQWQKSQGNFLRILSSFFVIFLFFVWFYGNFYSNFKQTSNEIMPYAGILIEVIYNFIQILFFTLFCNSLLLQKKYLYKEGEKQN